MSKIFYDHLVVLEEVEMEIKNIATSPDEKEELWRVVDDIVQHKVIISILDRLPQEHHEEFLDKFHLAPHHEGHLGYLNDRIEEEIVDVIKSAVNNLKEDLLREIKLLKKKNR